MDENQMSGGYSESFIEGRNAVIEAFRSGKTVDKVYILDGCKDGPIMTIKREAKKNDTIVKFVSKDLLDKMSPTGKQIPASGNYTVSYKNNKNAGTATVTIKFKGNYQGSKSLNYKITKAASSSTSATCSMRL